jgi:hypothetical protein
MSERGSNPSLSAIPDMTVSGVQSPRFARWSWFKN